MEPKDKNCLTQTRDRRAFLGLAGKALIIIALGGGLRLLEDKTKITRPPTALKDEDNFLTLCNRCQKCMDVCPFHLVAPVLFSESLISAGTPKLDLTRGTCTY